MPGWAGLTWNGRAELAGLATKKLRTSGGCSLVLLELAKNLFEKVVATILSRKKFENHIVATLEQIETTPGKRETC